MITFLMLGILLVLIGARGLLGKLSPSQCEAGMRLYSGVTMLTGIALIAMYLQVYKYIH